MTYSKYRASRVRIYRLRLQALDDECIQHGVCMCRLSRSWNSAEEKSRAIKLVLDEYKMAKDPYLRWDDGDLRACIRQRKLDQPTDQSTVALRRTLRDADSEMTFPLMQTPIELRLMVFKMALSIDQDNEMFIWNHKNVKKPSLLQTCREIRQIGTPLFYRNNSFVIETVDLTSRKVLRAPEGNWLGEIGGENIANLRFVTFGGDTLQGEYYRIKIDLAYNDPSGWTVCPDAEHHRTTCDASRTFTLAEKTVTDLSSKDVWKAQILRDCISIARKGMSKFHDECGYGTSMRPTVDALDDLYTPFLDVIDQCMKLGL